MFTPLESTIGALLIQFGTTSYLLQSGKTIGFSSTIYNSVVKPNVKTNISIITGILLSSLFSLKYLPDFIPVYPTGQAHLVKTVLAGLLVGYGTNYGCGCTSGHFLNGLARLRIRSLVATMCFCLTGIFTASYFDLASGCHDAAGDAIACFNYDKSFPLYNANKSLLLTLLAIGFSMTYFVLPKISKTYVTKETPEATKSKFQIFSSLYSSFFFGLGLIVSGMANPAKPLGFLSMFNFQKFDPSLAFIAIFAIIPNIFSFREIIRNHPAKPLVEEKYDLANSNAISKKFILGNLLFGVGWALIGVCPGPGLISTVLNPVMGLTWLASFFGGYTLANNL